MQQSLPRAFAKGVGTNTQHPTHAFAAAAFSCSSLLRLNSSALAFFAAACNGCKRRASAKHSVCPQPACHALLLAPTGCHESPLAHDLARVQLLHRTANKSSPWDENRSPLRSHALGSIRQSCHVLYLRARLNSDATEVPLVATLSSVLAVREPPACRNTAAASRRL